jgi:phosphoribosylanthranilate isomerase
MTRSDGIRVKVCGLTRPEDMASLVSAGAAYAGLNFFPASPRFVVPAQARAIALAAPPGLAQVGLFVDPDDDTLERVLAEVPLDLIQLHGLETPARVAEVRARHGLPVIKAIGVAGPADLSQIELHTGVADMLLIDAKPPKGAALPGGNGLAFDWLLIAGRRWPVPWLLAGGLTPDNVAEAVRLTGARQVDVSSGVEAAPGIKDVGRIAAFVAATRDQESAA